jgi:hypothetical protein
MVSNAEMEKQMYNSEWQFEMEAELNARDDYWSEIAAEHHESQEALDYEAEMNYQEEVKANLDAMEARGGPAYFFPSTDMPW